MRQPPLWIVTGVPGAGKSTTARALAAAEPRGVHIEGDALQRMIVSGGEPPRPEGGEESSRQIDLNVANQCLLARSFLGAGFAVAIDYVVATRARLSTYLDLLAPYRIRLVVLSPAPEVAEVRDRDRPTKHVLDQWRHLAAQMREELGSVGLWLDNGALDVGQTVSAIRASAVLDP